MKIESIYPRMAIYLVLAVYITASYSVLRFDTQVLDITVREDRFFETVGALAFLLTSILFFISFLKVSGNKKCKGKPLLLRFFFMCLALVFLLGAGEEISWGQRIFNVNTPDWLETINNQKETNLHNIYFFKDDILFTIDSLFNIFWFILTLALPAACVLNKSFKKFIEKYMPVVPLSIGLLFMFNYLWAKAAKLIFVSIYTYDRIPFKQAIQEIKESNYALLFIFIGIFFYSTSKKTEHDVIAN